MINIYNNIYTFINYNGNYFSQMRKYIIYLSTVTNFVIHLIIQNYITTYSNIKGLTIINEKKHKNI